MLRLHAPSSIVVAALTLAGALTLVPGNTSCASAPDKTRFTEIIQPDYPTYRASVDSYLQRRCGTLDCHGQPGRAYRLYGFAGFRFYNVDAGLVSGQQLTTEDEIRANYQALVALEPEEMSRFMATQGAKPNNLLVLRKPLRLERHKGGPSMSEEDAGYKCVVAWLRIRTVRPTADGLEFEPIPEAERDKLSASALQQCAEAQDYP